MAGRKPARVGLAARMDLALWVPRRTKARDRNMMPWRKSVRAKVGPAGLRDVGEARARLSRTVLADLGLKEGELVQVAAGSQSMLLRAYAAGAEDDGLDLVRLDGAHCRTLGVDVGDTVVVRRYDSPLAERVRLVAIGDLADVELSLDEIRSALAERPVVVGDTVTITPTRKTFDAQVSLLGLNLADVTGSVADAEGVLLRVAETTPAGVVSVDDSTQIEIRHAAVASDDDAEHA
jgi:transitional endoplasmic reticulum ATPase